MRKKGTVDIPCPFLEPPGFRQEPELGRVEAHLPERREGIVSTFRYWPVNAGTSQEPAAMLLER